MSKAILGLAAILLLAGLVAAACGGDEEKETPSPAAGGASGQVQMEANDFFFEPTQLSGEAGKAITVRLENEGKTPHTFTIDELKVDQLLDPGQEATITFTPSQAGTLAFYCRFHRAQGMEGSLSVSGGSSSATPGETSSDGGTPGSSSGY